MKYVICGLTVLIVLYFGVFKLYSYHNSTPKLVLTVEGGELSQPCGGMSYCSDEVWGIFNSNDIPQQYTERFFEKRKKLPLAIKGKQINILLPFKSCAILREYFNRKEGSKWEQKVIKVARKNWLSYLKV